MIFSLTAVTLFVFRRTRPTAERPYRCWGYPFVPAVFVAAAAGMTGLSLYDSALEGELWEKRLIWLVILSAGVPIYYVWRRFVEPATDRA